MEEISFKITVDCHVVVSACFQQMKLVRLRGMILVQSWSPRPNAVLRTRNLSLISFCLFGRLLARILFVIWPLLSHLLANWVASSIILFKGLGETLCKE